MNLKNKNGKDYLSSPFANLEPINITEIPKISNIGLTVIEYGKIFNENAVIPIPAKVSKVPTISLKKLRFITNS